MSQTFQTRGGFARRAFLCGMFLFIVAPVSAQSTRVVAVEEHWELRLGQPDSERSAPQTTMLVSPNGSLSSTHFIFTLNHASVPEYQPGGMQVQHWDGDELVDAAVFASPPLAHDQEVVRWTQRVSLEEGTLKFQIVDGQSETWGAFGGDDLLLSAPTSLANLNGYRPALSLTESQVNYAENRVVSLTLTKLVWKTDDGGVYEVNAPIPLDTSLDQ